MANGLQKSLQAQKDLLTTLTAPPQIFSSKSWVSSAFKCPKTPSAVDRDKPVGRDGAANLADIERFLFENLGSPCADGSQDGGDTNKDHNENAFNFESPRKMKCCSGAPMDQIHSSRKPVRVRRCVMMQQRPSDR